MEGPKCRRVKWCRINSFIGGPQRTPLRTDYQHRRKTEYMFQIASLEWTTVRWSTSMVSFSKKGVGLTAQNDVCLLIRFRLLLIIIHAWILCIC